MIDVFLVSYIFSYKILNLHIWNHNPSFKKCYFTFAAYSICCRRCPARILAVEPFATTSCFRGPMSGIGLRRAGTRRCYLQGRGAWWGTRPRVLSSTLISFGGIRVGHFRCGGSRPRRRWYVAVSGRRTSTSIATWFLWTSGSPIPGRFFGQMTGDMVPWWFLLSGCPLLAPQEPWVA